MILLLLLLAVALTLCAYKLRGIILDFFDDTRDIQE